MFAMYLNHNPTSKIPNASLGTRLLAAGALTGSLRPGVRPRWSCLFEDLLSFLTLLTPIRHNHNKEEKHEAYQYVLSRVTQEMGSDEIFLADETSQDHCTQG